MAKYYSNTHIVDEGIDYLFEWADDYGHDFERHVIIPQDEVIDMIMEVASEEDKKMFEDEEMDFDWLYTIYEESIYYRLEYYAREVVLGY